jgi:hypothetical protein
VVANSAPHAARYVEACPSIGERVTHQNDGFPIALDRAEAGIEAAPNDFDRKKVPDLLDGEGAGLVKHAFGNTECSRGKGLIVL